MTWAHSAVPCHAVLCCKMTQRKLESSVADLQRQNGKLQEKLAAAGNKVCPGHDKGMFHYAHRHAQSNRLSVDPSRPLAPAAAAETAALASAVLHACGANTHQALQQEVPTPAYQSPAAV